VPLSEVDDTGAWEVVYNLRVADYRTYFVGDDTWSFAAWAHNRYELLFDQDYSLFPEPPPQPEGPHGQPGVNYNRFTPVRGNPHPLTPPTESSDPFAQPRGFALRAVNEIRSYFKCYHDKLSTTCVAVVRINGVIQVWVSGSGENSKVDDKRRAILYQLTRGAGYSKEALPVYRIINPDGTANTNRQNDAERHILREIAQRGSRVELLALASTLRMCQSCLQALEKEHRTPALASPTVSKAYLALPPHWKELG